MRRSVIIALIALAFFKVFAVYGSDLLPVDESLLGVPYEELIEIHPAVRLVSAERDTSGGISHGIAYLETPDGKFWNAAMIEIKGDSVESFSLVVHLYNEDSRSNVTLILSQLVDMLGDGYEVRVVVLRDMTTRYLAPLVSWGENDLQYNYCFTPPSKYDEIELLNCQLTVMRRTGELATHFVVNDSDSIATRALPLEVEAIIRQMKGK